MLTVFGPLQIVVVCIVGAFWVFVLWMLWKIIHELKEISVGVKEVAAALRQKP